MPVLFGLSRYSLAAIMKSFDESKVVRNRGRFAPKGSAPVAGEKKPSGGAKPSSESPPSKPSIDKPQADGGASSRRESKPGPASPAVKQWLGKSAVVDESGEPLVVYHGTHGKEFDTFRDEASNAWSDSLGFPTYFHTDGLATASTYANQFSDGYVRKDYLKIEKPLEIDAKGGEWVDALSEAVDKIRTYRTPEEKDYLDFKSKFEDQYGYELENAPDEIPSAAMAEMQERQKQMDRHVVENPELYKNASRKPYGYDGIIVKNVLDMTAADVGEEVGSYNPYATVYVSFSPQQIKSADKPDVAPSADRAASSGSRSPKLERLSSLESEISKLPKERGFLVSADGEVLSEMNQGGDATELELSPEQEKLAKGAVLTHNHPGDVGLSVGDLFQASRLDLAEIRAVTPKGVVHSLVRPASGWPSWDEINRVEPDANISALNETKEKDAAGAFASKAEARAYMQGAYMRNLASKLGLTHAQVPSGSDAAPSPSGPTAGDAKPKAAAFGELVRASFPKLPKGADVIAQFGETLPLDEAEQVFVAAGLDELTAADLVADLRERGDRDSVSSKTVAVIARSQLYKADEAGRRSAVVDAVGGDRVAMFEVPDERQTKFIVHPSTRSPGKWQLSRMDKDGPVGHSEFDSQDEALASAVAAHPKGHMFNDGDSDAVLTTSVASNGVTRSHGGAKKKSLSSVLDDVSRFVGFDVEMDRYRLRCKTFDESKHRRGQPGNAGQFAPKGSGKPSSLSKKTRSDSAGKKVKPIPVGNAKLRSAIHRIQDFDLDRYAEHFKTTPQAVQKKWQSVVEKAVSKAKIFVAMPPDILEMVLDDGRYKSQFESGITTGEDENHEGRAYAEHMLFGVPVGVKAHERPVYGYASSEDPTSGRHRGKGPYNNHQQTRGYGSVAIQLKDSVKDRATITFGDSLNNSKYQTASPMRSPSWRSLAFKIVGDEKPFTPSVIKFGSVDGQANSVYPQKKGSSSTRFMDSRYGGDYTEVQIYHGLPVSDIEKVWFEKPPSASAQAKLKKLGIKWAMKK